jgi:hypothetical protein
MRDGAPFGIAGIWENWKNPAPESGSAQFAIKMSYHGRTI